MPLLPGAEPFRFEGGAVGALVLHGFTGTPGSVRPWGEGLAAAGLAVEGPLLPGHGTTWPELNRTRWTDWYAEADRALGALRGRCEQVVVCGLSMGGCLALRLAEQRPGAVDALVLVNPSVLTTRRSRHLAPLLSRWVPSAAGVAGDIRAPGVTEVGYDRTPLAAFASLQQLWRRTRADLAAVTAPLLLLRSATDHVVEPRNAQVVLRGVSSRVRREQVLANSYHVATLDEDAPTILAATLDAAAALPSRAAAR